jgi:hypothetical protein
MQDANTGYSFRRMYKIALKIIGGTLKRDRGIWHPREMDKRRAVSECPLFALRL